MSQYDALDGLIIAAICGGADSFLKIFAGDVAREAGRLAEATRGIAFRTVDKRLQALRKRGDIKFQRPDGWVLA